LRKEGENRGGGTVYCNWKLLRGRLQRGPKTPIQETQKRKTKKGVKIFTIMSDRKKGEKKVQDNSIKVAPSAAFDNFRQGKMEKSSWGETRQDIASREKIG